MSYELVPNFGVHERTHLHRKFRTLLIFVALIIVGCTSSDPSATAIQRPNDQSLANEANGPVLSSDEGSRTTTVAPPGADEADDEGASNGVVPAASASPTTTSTTTTTVPPTTEPPLFSTVHVSPGGDDDNFGEADAPVASIDRAIARLAPGGTVEFAPGEYPPLVLQGIDGGAGQPIRLLGGPGVEFRSSRYDADAGILVSNSHNIEIVNMTVRRSLWGIYVEASTAIAILGNDIADIGQEAVRVKAGSSNVLIDGNRIADTGLRTDQGIPNGEGIYIGTGTPSGEDQVSNVTISNNELSNIRDEAIDLKFPVSNITVTDNTISNIVTHTSGAVVVHLNSDSGADPNIVIERNIIRNVTRASEFRDGNCIVTATTVRIVNNVLHDCEHRGIYLRGEQGQAEILHNTFLNTGSLGAIVDEGLGIDFVSSNNLGTSGDTNLEATASDFVAADQSDYRLDPAVASEFADAESSDVTDDLFGIERGRSGSVTFGAVESQ